MSTIANLASATFNVAQISAGRIYLSYDKPLSTDAPDGANPGDLDYRTRFDKLELTYSQGVGGKANLTAVDFFAIPLLLETSIQGTVIEHLTLAPQQTGSALQIAITGLIAPAKQNVAVITTAKAPHEVLRILAPVKAPEAYGSFDNFLDTLPTSSVDIAGTYFGKISMDYHYTGTIGTKDITLTETKDITRTENPHTIVVSRASLAYNATNLIDNNGIYTCNAPFHVDTLAHTVADNDIYAAVYRDLVTGFNLGFMKKVANVSNTWWDSPAFPANAFSGTYYNAYAQVVATSYPGAYGFPFADRYKHVLADLGGKVDAVKVTVLADDTVAPAYTPKGNVNPQTLGVGSPSLSLILVTSDDNFNTTTFALDLQSYQGGNAYSFPTTYTGTSGDAKSAQVNGVPTQEGLNVYTLVLRGSRYSVLAQVSNNAVVWASIAGGGNATLSGTDVYIGGLN